MVLFSLLSQKEKRRKDGARSLRCLVTLLHSQEGMGTSWCSAYSLPLIQSKILAYGMVAPHLGWVFPTSLKLSGYTITRPTQGVSLNPVNWTMKIDYLRSRLKLDLGVLQDSETKITDAPEVTEMKVKVKH